ELRDVEVHVAPWRRRLSEVVGGVDLVVHLEGRRLQDLPVEADAAAGDVELVEGFLRDGRVRRANLAPHPRPKIEAHLLSIFERRAAPVKLEPVSLLPGFPGSDARRLLIAASLSGVALGRDGLRGRPDPRDLRVLTGGGHAR